MTQAARPRLRESAGTLRTWLCESESCCQSTGRRYFFPLLSPPTSGLARRGRRGAQLDGEFAFYSSRRRLRSWPGGGGGGMRSWTGSLLSTAPPPTSVLARRGRWRGALPWRGVCLSIIYSLDSPREAKLC